MFQKNDDPVHIRAGRFNGSPCCLVAGRWRDCPRILQVVKHNQNVALQALTGYSVRLEKLLSIRYIVQPGNHYDSPYKVGQDNVRIFRMELHNPVFFITAFITIGFVVAALLSPQHAEVVLGQAKSWSIENFDWLVMISGNFFVFFCLLLIVLPWGRVRLGGEGALPEFSRLSWFSMLFAAGMGIGLVFWCVAEPVAYYTNWSGTPLNLPPHSPEAAAAAMGAALYHWGLHPWAIFAVVALSLAFFSFNKGLPLATRSIFYPLFGEQCWRWPGHIIDVVAVFATIFGLATSLGLGAKQATGGLHSVFGVDNGLTTQLLLIAVITMIAIISVVRGLDRGVRVLSNFNILLALLLLVFVTCAGPTLRVVSGIAENLVNYATHFIPLSDWTGREDNAWYKSWTVFYWAWWISWSPFVGVFIARISRGRTVREFVTAVLLVPTLVSSVWMSVFGGLALDQVQQGIGALAGGIDDPSLALFHMLENLPFTILASLVAVVLVLTFFITSADSGSLVVDIITAGGKLDTPRYQRAFWAVLLGFIAAALLIGGGSDALSALQAGTITMAVPFTLVLLLACLCLVLGLLSENGNNRGRI